MIFEDIKQLYFNTFRNKNISNKKLLIGFLPIYGSLIILNIMITMSFGGGAQHLDGEIVRAHSQELLRACIISNFLSVPVFGFIIGIFVAIFPFSGLNYFMRYRRAVIYTIFALYFMLFLLGIYRILN